MKNKFIGIIADSTPELSTGILAILKSGNSFVSINPIFPNRRIRFILNDCNIDTLLSDKANYEKARQVVEECPFIQHVLCMDDITGIRGGIRGQTKIEQAKRGRISADDPAYVIYTSGSTGKPKGVPITHENLTPLFYYSREYLRLGVHTRVMQNLSYTFDFGVFEILTTLLFGGRLYVLNKSTAGDFHFYVCFINRHFINTLHTTPIFLNNLADACDACQKIPSLKLIHLGGEQLTGNVVRKILDVISRDCILYNGYGPTEASINCTFFSLTTDEMAANTRDNIPIGHPCDRAEIYILDKFLNPQTINAAGELYIAGSGVSQGYLNRPELTCEKFNINNINRSYRSNKTYILYKTSDLARWLSDGNIEFLGRIDQQVKIRGFRIELGEIENTLSLYPGIKETIVLAFEHENYSNYLCAYFVTQSTELTESTQHPTVSQLREFLLKRLPDYMIPAYFIRLEKIPLTSTGKIEKKSLPKPNKSLINTGSEYIPPVTYLEKKLAFIWQDLLPIKQIGGMDDFFQLGGDSILVNRCIARIREELHAEIPLRKFFEHPFIKSLAEEIEKQERQEFSIKPAGRVGEIPLSFAQERLWFLQELDSENAAYFVPRVIRMKGNLDIYLIERTFTEIIRRHEILRTTFPIVNGQPVQRIKPPYEFNIPVLDWSRMEKIKQEQKVTEFLSEEDRRPFDFEKGPLLRVTILKLKEEEHLFVLTEHHLVHDGWTQGVLLREFIIIFSAYAEGKEHGLPQLSIQYADFALWQRKHLSGKELEWHLLYWQEKLTGLAPVLELPADRPRPTVISGKGELQIVRMSGAETNRLKVFSRKCGATLFMTMLAVFKTLLYRYAGVEDLCVGTGIANRRYKEMEGMLGMVINTLPLRTQLNGDMTFKECLNRVKETCLEAYQHEDTPFGKIVERIQPERSLSYSPIFQVMFTFMDTPGGDLKLPGLELELLPVHNRSAKFDINVVVVPPLEQAEEPDGNGEILVEWEYNTDIFDPLSIKRMVSHYGRLLTEGLNQPETAISGLPMLPDEELKNILFEFNNTDTVYPCDKTIPQLFAEQVEKTPELVGLAEHKTSLQITYRHLNEQADCLANLLIEKGVLTGDVVGIMMARSIDLIIGIMGILKTGAVYLPIDPGSPGERIDYMLKDSGAKLLLTANDKEGEKVGRWEGENLKGSPRWGLLHSMQLVYIIYTSGSTGTPKGVPITHTNLCTLLHWGYDIMGWGPGDHVIQTLAYYFDWSAWEIFLTITSGASLYMITEELLLNPVAQLDFIQRNDITVMEATPTRFQSLIASGPKPGALNTLRCLCIGAEKLTVGLVKQAKTLITRDCKVFNLYGPTEATIISAAFEIDMGTLEKYEYLSSIPIGKMVGNGPLLVLDQYLNLCPVNVVGELYITGDGVACGYLNNLELTSEKFNKNRSYRSNRTNIIFYKTGDLARWLPDGNIEYLGRIDQQVKIRGFRIELGEITRLLLKHKNVKEAVVIDRSDGADKYICAYIVPGASTVPQVIELRDFLSKFLPDYMIPAFFIMINQVPLNANGKIDRKALSEIEIPNMTCQYIAPADIFEEKLTEIWAEVLRIEKKDICVTAGFFELGGHSLKATTLVLKIHEVLDINISLQEFFRNSSIRKLAEYAKEKIKSGKQYSTIEAVEKKEYYMLSSPQRRYYILQQLDPGNTSFNICQAGIFTGTLDMERLKNVFTKLIQRHDIFRTSFEYIGSAPVQKIHPEVKFEIEPLPVPTGEEFSLDEMIDHFIRSFDLSVAPLLRVGAAKIAAEKYFLVIDVHHIISDGLSQEILMKEFQELYAGMELPYLKLQYKDFSEWQNSAKGVMELKKQEEYWLNILNENVPLLSLPSDYPRGKVQQFEGNSVVFETSFEEYLTLKKIAADHDVTLYIIFLAICNIWLFKICTQDTIAIGSGIGGRKNPDLQHMVGSLQNMIVLVNRLEDYLVFSKFLEKVKQTSLEAFENQDYPFDELVIKAAAPREPGRNPLFDFFYILNTVEMPAAESPQSGSLPMGLQFTPYRYSRGNKKGRVRFDLALYGIDNGESVSFILEYSAKLFKHETALQLVDYLKKITAAILKNENIRLQDITFFTKLESNDERFAPQDYLDFSF